MEKSHALYKKILKHQQIEDYELVQMTVEELRMTFSLLSQEIDFAYSLARTK